MADGTIQGRRSAIGQYAHTNANAVSLCSITLPTTDGYYVLTGRSAGGTAAGATNCASQIVGVGKVDTSLVSIVSTTGSMDAGGTGYVLSLSGSDTTVHLVMSGTGNTHRTIGYLEAVGVDVAITAG